MTEELIAVLIYIALPYPIAYLLVYSYHQKTDLKTLKTSCLFASPITAIGAMVIGLESSCPPRARLVLLFVALCAGGWWPLLKWLDYLQRTKPERDQRREAARQEHAERGRLRQEEHRRSITGLVEWYTAQKSSIDSAPLDADKKAEAMIALENRYGVLLDQMMREVTP